MSKKTEEAIETLAGRLDASYIPVPVFIVWRDHTGKAQYAEKGLGSMWKPAAQAVDSDYPSP